LVTSIFVFRKHRLSNPIVKSSDYASSIATVDDFLVCAAFILRHSHVTVVLCSVRVSQQWALCPAALLPELQPAYVNKISRVDLFKKKLYY